MTFDLDSSLEPMRAQYPVACRFVREVANDKLLRSAVTYLVATEPDYISRIAPALDVLSKMYAVRGQSLESGLEALLEYTHLYMRHQVQFLSKGAYSNTDFEQVYRDVYDNEELMRDTYLPGLYLTQLCWPVHYRVLSRYERDFLSMAGTPRRMLEFGVGHGMTLWVAKKRFPSASCLAFDVSRHSIAFAEGLLRTDGVDMSTVRFELADVVKHAPAETDACDMGTMGEILEHVEDPRRALANFRTLLRTGGHAFITTVIDSNAVDHIYQFASQAEIDQMITDARFEMIRSELIRPADLRLEGEPGSDPTRYYVGIARAR